MNVLVTGAAGFIGSHLVDACLHSGDSVVGIDNLCTGNTDNLRRALENKRFSFFEADLTTRWYEVEEYIGSRNITPQLVYHFASPASPVDYAALPIETLMANSLGTKNCAEASVRWGAALVFASTSECYGDPKEHPQNESYWGNVNPVGPRSCYDEGKRFGEAVISAYLRTSGLDARIVRIFNTYGPRMRPNDGRVVPNFIAQALAGEPLTIYGDGTQTRSFCYVDDLVGGIRLCAASSKARGSVVNLGNPEERTIREFAQLVCEIVGVPFREVARPMPIDDPGRRCPDITRAREMLGWGPSIDIRDGLERTIEFFAARGHAKRRNEIPKALL